LLSVGLVCFGFLAVLYGIVSKILQDTACKVILLL